MEVFNRIAGLFSKYPFLKKTNFPKNAIVTEVGPRDGLHFEKMVVSTDTKIEWIDMLTKARFPYIECTTFFAGNNKIQSSDCRTVAQSIVKNKEHTKYMAFANNPTAVDMAKEDGMDKISFMGSLSEEAIRKIMSCSVIDSIKQFDPLIEHIASAKLESRMYLADCFGTPGKETMDAKKINDVCNILSKTKLNEIVIMDSMAAATPEIVDSLLGSLNVDKSKICLHFHDTKYSGLENVLMGLKHGYNRYDGSIAGLGQCFFHQSLLGNIVTEDLVFMLDVMGIGHGIKVNRMLDAGDIISEKMMRENLTDVFDVDFKEELPLIRQKYKELISVYFFYVHYLNNTFSVPWSI